MGRFRSKSHKQRRKEKIFILIMILIIYLIINVFLYTKIKSHTDILNNVTMFYLGLNFTEKQKNKINKEENDSQQIKPIIYIYNTHQKENYTFNTLNSYNLDYNVYFASQILAAYLEPYAIFEKQDINEILKENNYTYADSYKASRMLLEKSKIDNPTLVYYIDLHRDSAPYEYTTCNIDNKNYAKIMFVLGGENANYLENEKFMNSLDTKLKEVNECLSRGVLKKEGQGVNGLYNQDFSSYNILIEVGGQYNSIDEVNNTLEIFSKIYLEVINQ